MVRGLILIEYGCVGSGQNIICIVTCGVVGDIKRCFNYFVVQVELLVFGTIVVFNTHLSPKKTWNIYLN